MPEPETVKLEPPQILSDVAERIRHWLIGKSDNHNSYV